MTDNKAYKIGITVKEPWANNISYAALNYTLWRVQDGGDGCGYVALKPNYGVQPDSDKTTWVKAVERGQSIYDYCIEYGLFEGTEEEFAQAWADAVAAANAAAQSAASTEHDVEAAEALRVTAEQGRVQAEEGRVNAEQTRVNAEQTRINDEGTRVDNEQARVDAEGTRVGNESGRVDAEAARVTAEQGRVDAETARVRETAAAITDTNNARDFADAATQRANTAAAGAEKVNATLSGTTLTVTNRNGVQVSVDTKGEKGDKGDPGVTPDTSVFVQKSSTAGLLKNDGTVDTTAYITASVNNLVNYYLKADTYTKAEVQALVDAVKQFTYQIVSTLPTASADTMHKIYLTPSSDPQTQNVKDEFITIDNGQEAQTRYTWEQIGSTAIDLSGYYTSQQTDAAITAALNTALADYTTTANLTTLLSGKQDTIDSSHKLSADLVDDTNATNKFVSASDKQTWNAKYDKPSNGIPSTDLADGVLPTTMVGSGTGHKGGLVPDPGATAGTENFLREDGTWAKPAGGGGAAYTPTLNAAPTTSTTTYTKDGQTVNFEVGQFARVAVTDGWDMYQLYDITNGVATWNQVPTTDYVDGLIGGINTILDNINGEVI